jgi:hypothetical protein
MKKRVVICLSVFVTSCGFLERFQSSKSTEDGIVGSTFASLMGQAPPESLQLTDSIQTIELTARKDYRPAIWTDGKHSFPKDTEFKIPTSLQVVLATAETTKVTSTSKKSPTKKRSNASTEARALKVNQQRAQTF